ncbi:UNVERIFIED_CONTAM: hypothetical protein FKN15_018840 [Acipenser sinensis]
MNSHTPVKHGECAHGLCGRYTTRDPLSLSWQPQRAHQHQTSGPTRQAEGTQDVASPHTSIPGGISRVNALDSHLKLLRRSLSSPSRAPEGWRPQTPFSAQQLQFWHACTSDTLVLATVQNGYALQIHLGAPPFRGIKNTFMTGSGRRRLISSPPPLRRSTRRRPSARMAQSIVVRFPAYTAAPGLSRKGPVGGSVSSPSDPQVAHENLVFDHVSCYTASPGRSHWTWISSVRREPCTCISQKGTPH